MAASAVWHTASTYFDAVCSNFRIADAIDIVLVAVFVHWAILGLKRARSRFVVSGIAVLAVLYALAQQVDLRVTLLLFHGVITVAVVALVVIFQEDIRRAFERLASTPGRRLPRSGNPVDLVVDLVVQVTAVLARSKTGALLVFKGKEPLTRHISGGVPLGGKLSQPLVLSIFDTSSPGHDGALVIEDGLASVFGVHLPLSTNVMAEAGFGTRHTAAMGLSECSDALVVVVSEERGSISVAQEGSIQQVSLGELRDRLSRFLEGLAPQVARRWWSGLWSENLGPKILSLVIASAAWMLLVGHQSQVITRTVTAPVVFFDVPEGWQLEEPRPNQVRVSLSGSNVAFQRFDPSQIAISLAVNELRRGTQRVAVRETDLDLPEGLLVEGIEPRFITVVAYETVTREVPVRPQTVGKLGPGLVLRGVRSEPDRVPLVFRRNELGDVRMVTTEPIDLGEVRQTTSFSRELIIPRGVHLSETTPETVKVTVQVEQRPPPSNGTGGDSAALRSGTEAAGLKTEVSARRAPAN